MSKTVRASDPAYVLCVLLVNAEVVGLEQGPLGLLSTIEELFGRKSSGSGL
jgi:hypothetical protein